jgi:hypothetical protein
MTQHARAHAIAVYLAWAQWCRARGAAYEQEAQGYEAVARTLEGACLTGG